MWIKELESLSNETQSTIYFITNLVDVWQELNSYSHGFIISASESDLDAHKETHEIFRIAPSTISTVTLQHGFECVGFLMNDNHQKYYGSSVGFASDYICGWSPKELQRNLRKLQHTRYQNFGPTAWLTKTNKRNLTQKSTLRIYQNWALFVRICILSGLVHIRMSICLCNSSLN